MGAVVGAVGAALSFIGGGSAVAGAVQVAAAVGTAVYQRNKQKKAKAAAARLARQQRARAAALAKQMQKIESAGISEFSFSSAAGRTDLTLMIRRSIVSRRVVYGRARLGGIWVYVETSGPSSEYLDLVLALCEGPVDAIEKIYFGDEEVTFDGAFADGTLRNATGKFAGYAFATAHLGTDSQAADSFLTSQSAKWTVAHKLAGVCYLAIRLVRNPDLMGSVPEISAVVRGKNNILDPRDNSTGYTDNAALCLADYLTTAVKGPGVPWADIDVDALKHAADVCDEPVALLSGGTEPRYRVSGVIDLASSVEDNRELFAQAMGGDVLYIGGKWIIQAGEYLTPLFTITPDMLAGPIELSCLQPRRERANVVKGTFISEANAWQRFDFPAVRDNAAVVQDGQEVVADLNLELVGSGSQAQRLARQMLRQARRGRTVTLRCNLMAMPARAGGTVLLDIPRYFANEPFQIVETRFGVGNDNALFLELELVETHPDIFAWDTGMEKQINVPPPLSAGPPQVAQPVFSPPPGEYDAGDFPLAVSISTITPGATIRWSTSAVPVAEGDGAAYTGPVSIMPGQTLYAKAFRNGYVASNPAIGGYVSA